MRDDVQAPGPHHYDPRAHHTAGHDDHRGCSQRPGVGGLGTVLLLAVLLTVGGGAALLLSRRRSR